MMRLGRGSPCRIQRRGSGSMTNEHRLDLYIRQLGHANGMVNNPYDYGQASRQA